MSRPALVVAIPGPWTNRSDLVAAVRRADTGFVIAGRNLKQAATNDSLPVSVDEHDPELAAAFATQGAAAGVSPDAVLATRTHARVARMAVEAEGPELARKVLIFSAAIVAAGGYGVRVESGRKVLSAKAWLQYAATAVFGDSKTAVYAAFVSLAPMPDGSCYYSVGMQALGLPDAAAPSDLSVQRAGEVLATFLVHCFGGVSELKDDAMFRPPGAQHFKLRHAPCAHFPHGHPQHNPHGIWHLR